MPPTFRDAAGIRVFSEELGNHEHVEDDLQAMDLGIDPIQTDHPLRVMRAIELWMDRNSPASANARATEKGKP